VLAAADHSVTEFALGWHKSIWDAAIYEKANPPTSREFHQLRVSYVDYIWIEARMEVWISADYGHAFHDLLLGVNFPACCLAIPLHSLGSASSAAKHRLNSSRHDCSPSVGNLGTDFIQISNSSLGQRSS
jgi:hypothetical protein